MFNSNIELLSRLLVHILLLIFLLLFILTANEFLPGGSGTTIPLSV
jgi:hypothetical protein